MNKIKRNLTIILTLILSIGLIILSTFKVNAEESYSSLYDNICEQENAYYRIDETKENLDLYYGVNYRHDIAYSLIKSSDYIVGMACGGSTYGNIALTTNTEYSQSAHILTIPSQSGIKIVPWTIINNGNWTLSTILQVAENYEETHPGYKVIAGINGDFFDISATGAYPRTVSGACVCDGEVLKAYTSSSWPAIAFKNDGSTTPFIKVDNPTYDKTQTLSIYDNNDNIIYEIKVDSVNGDLVNIGSSETKLVFANYTNEETQKHIVNKKEVSNAYIVSNPDKTVAYSESSFYGIGKIDKKGDGTIDANQFAIITNNTDLQRYLNIGVKIRVQNSLTGELKDATNVSGICATFLVDGNHQEVTHYDYMQYRYPRTLIGYKANGDVVMAVTDGRQADKGYYGLNGVESACQMALEGCVEAYSFDGGGSTTMVILKNGKLTCVNSPSDGGLRSDGNAILVVAEVPEINVKHTESTSSITFTFDVVKMIEAYKDLYIECDGKKKRIEENTTVTFESLSPNTTYNYAFYALVGGEYYAIPIVGEIRTDKEKYILNDVNIQTKISSTGAKTYEIKVDITDDYNTIVTAVLIVNGKRVNLKDGIYSVPESYGNPLTEGVLSITYEVNQYIGRLNDQIITFNVNLDDPILLIDGISDILNNAIDDILSGK